MSVRDGSIRMVVAMVALVAAACANNDGVGRPGGRDAGGGARPDAGVWRPDGGGGDGGAMASRDAGATASRDAGRVTPRDAGGSVRPDAGTGTPRSDAGSDAGRDAGVAPPGAPNDYCTGAIDITTTGTYAGTTCMGSHDDADPMCMPGLPPSPDVYYYVDTRPGPAGSVYHLRVDTGFAIGFSPGGCGAFGSCLTSSPNDSYFSGGGGVRWYFFVERLGGACGDFTLSVEGPDAT